MKLILMLLMAGLLTAASCGRKGGTVAPATNDLAGTYKLIEPSSAYPVTLVLTPDSANAENPNRVSFRVGGRSSVNSYFATIVGSAASSAVQISAIGSTKMAGPAEAMQFETTYFGRLQNVKRYERTGKRLRLIAEGDNPGVLVYEKTN